MELHGHPLPTEDRVAALERRVEVLTGLLEAFAWTNLGLALAVVLVTVHRGGGQVWSNVFNLLHVVLSGAVALVSLRLSRKLLSRWLTQAWQHYAWAGASVLLLGGGLEVAQLFVPGSPSVSDLVIDVVGGVGALGFAFGLERPRKSRMAFAIQIASVIAVAAALASPSTALWRALRRATRFPVLTNFELADASYLALNDGATLGPVRGAPAPSQEWLAELAMPRGGFPGIELIPPAGDWRDFSELVVPVYSPEDQPFSLELRVHDEGHADNYEQRFNRSLMVETGRNEFRIAVSDIANGPRARQVVMNKIEGIVLFAAGPERPHRVLLGGWRLEGARVR